MPERINWWFHVYFMLFFLVMGGMLLWRARKQGQGWRRIAAARNLVFSEKQGLRHQQFVPRFRLLGDSAINDPTEMLSGVIDGRNLLLFNWFFQSGNTLQAVRGGFACAVVGLPTTGPRLAVFHKSLGPFAGPSGDTVLVLDDAAFHDDHVLLCNHRKGADALLTQAVRDLFRTRGPLWLERDGDALLLAWPGTWEPERFEADLAKLLDLLRCAAPR